MNSVSLRLKISHYLWITFGFIFAIFIVFLLNDFVDTKPNKTKGAEQNEVISEESIASLNNAITLSQFIKGERELFDAIEAKIRTPDVRGVYEKLNLCISQWDERMENVGPPNYREDHDWFQVMTLSSKNGIGRIEKFDIAKGTSWPTYFDEEVKECFLSAFESIEFEIEKDIHVNVTYKMCTSAAKKPGGIEIE